MKSNDPRNHANEHEKCFSDISWIVFDFRDHPNEQAGEENEIMTLLFSGVRCSIAGASTTIASV